MKKRIVIICFIVITAIEEHKDEKIEKQIDEIRKKGDKR